ncbi:ATP-binding cassette domain-containing protein [Alkalinema sp. FACHB-956]|uniref:ATP-binding cassette domain-containing protein n=1 Tax=Alkalinema sp. FACHB-956 TaxID=2692768 RepID=UPI001682F604|nr:ATP-binding cassette domain-containing protein [Alkalinema sp. FACHB-956]MBD2329649.1 ATP-binding cassette domain-containing protein [Alkalinema sp. FACHB-956]
MTHPETLIGQAPYLELKKQGQVCRFDLTRDRHVLGRNPQLCDLVVPPDWDVISGCHAILQRIGDNYEILDGDGNKPSTNGLFINQTRITVSESFRLKNGTTLKVGQDPRNMILLSYCDPSASTQLKTLSPRSILLNSSVITIGRDSTCDLVLDAPTISRIHATIEKRASGYVLCDKSVNGIFANSRRVESSIAIEDNMTVNIGPFTLMVQNNQLRILDSGTQIRLDAYSLKRQVLDEAKNTKLILNDVTLAIEPGQFVALVGGSGAGKSTLMKALFGLEPTTSGQVLINGCDLRSNFNIYRTQIGYVPQDDIIHRDLTALEALTYAAKLRLPPDANIDVIVAKTLEQIELTPAQQNTKIQLLSGGQRKRVCIGVELLADPKLFFLDEPTSGLDPGLDKKMMQLLRKLADEGRTIILVTHATANVTLCDRVAFMGRGGFLCFFGPPQEAHEFFNEDDFADIYTKLENQDDIINCANYYSQSSYYDRYIRNHLSLQQNAPIGFVVPTQAKPSFIEQTKLLTQRYWQLVLRDQANLIISLITAPIGVSLISFAVKNNAAFLKPEVPDSTLAPLAIKILFVFTCASLWVGLSGALQEIVKETPIYIRERLVNLSLSAYLGSKVLVLAAIAMVQSLLMSIVVMIVFQSPTSEMISWPIGLTVTNFLTLIASYSLGLLISSLVRSTAQANSALPLLLIPQIIFSGVLFATDGAAKILGWFMLGRWSVGAYGTLINLNALIPEQKKLPDGSLLPRPLEPSAVYDANWSNLSLNWGLLCIHIVVCLCLAGFFQKRKDIC